MIFEFLSLMPIIVLFFSYVEFVTDDKTFFLCRRVILHCMFLSQFLIHSFIDWHPYRFFLSALNMRMQAWQSMLVTQM